MNSKSNKGNNLNTIYLGDNLKGLDYVDDNSIHICYIDPPYNTGNTFNYNDNVSKDEWKKEISLRVKKVKNKLTKDGVVLFSISEESIFDSYEILKNEFKYVFEPLIWQTKNSLNQNKVSNISSINCEFILVASNEKIKTNKEIIYDENLLKEKRKNYPLSIVLNKDMDSYNYIIKDGKKIFIIDSYEISKNNNQSYKNHKYQKRTAQKGHGSMRYIDLIKSVDNYNENNLYFIDGVNDNQGLGGKFILGNSYFQSIGEEIELKMPNFLGFYQGGISGFQTAKPIELLKRILNNFNIYKNTTVMDLYTGSGNVIKAIDGLKLNFIGFEIGGIENKNIEILKNNLNDLNQDIFYKKI